MKLRYRNGAVGASCAALVVAAIAGLVLTACMAPAPKPVAVLNDGELPVPADYLGWSKFLAAVQRPDAKQVREIYVNPVGAKAVAGQPFPDGTVFVMENYAARANPDGTLAQGADGKLVKGDLLRIFVMGKNPGWGDKVAPPELKNGTWIYAPYDSAGKAVADPIINCRACHLPLAGKDFVHRYDEYFASR